MEDLIKRSDVIKVIEEIETERLRGQINLTYAPSIKRINDLPSEDKPKVNAVLRLDFLKRQFEALFKEYDRLISECSGEWIYCEDDDGQDGYRCSNCDFFVPWYYDYEDSNYILDYKVCPYCGARMKGADDEEQTTL